MWVQWRVQKVSPIPLPLREGLGGGGAQPEPPPPKPLPQGRGSNLRIQSFLHLPAHESSFPSKILPALPIVLPVPSGPVEALISILFHGLAYAMILYIVSVGLSVTMGLMGFVNLAHGAFAMAGGYVTVTLMNGYAVPFSLALLAAFIVMALISVVLERTLYAACTARANWNRCCSPSGRRSYGAMNV